MLSYLSCCTPSGIYMEKNQQVHAAHRERQKKDEGQWKPLKSIEPKKNTRRHKPQKLTALFVLLLQERYDDNNNTTIDGKVERKEGKAKQSSEAFVIEDQAEAGMSQRSRALFTQHLKQGCFLKWTFFK